MVCLPASSPHPAQTSGTSSDSPSECWAGTAGHAHLGTYRSHNGWVHTFTQLVGGSIPAGITYIYQSCTESRCKCLLRGIYSNSVHFVNNNYNENILVNKD
jgi:hypothetical protein